MYPDLWVDEDEEEGKNLNEGPLIQTQLDRYRRKNTFSYHKINDSTTADKLIGQFKQLEKYDLNVIVLNFIDMLSHARTESKMVRELASNEAAYRSITQSWFRHSAVKDLFKALAASDYKNHRHDRPRQYPREVTGQSHRGQEHEHELALQTGEKSEIQPQRSL